MPPPATAPAAPVAEVSHQAGQRLCGAVQQEAQSSLGARPAAHHKIDLFEAVVRRSPWTLHVPLFRLDDGPLREVNGGSVETGEIVSLEPMARERAERHFPLARHYASEGLRAARLGFEDPSNAI